MLVSDHDRSLGFTLPMPIDMVDYFVSEISRRVAKSVRHELSAQAEDGWMSTKDAAAYAGCSVNSLQKAMAAGDVRSTKDHPGRKRYFKRAWIDEWRDG